MRRRFCVLLAALAPGALLPRPAAAAGEGLWVGTATLNAVSGVNRPTPDLAFDLSLVGIRAEDDLVSKGAAGWSYLSPASRPAAGWQTGTGTGWSGASAPVTRSAGAGAVYLRRSFDLPTGRGTGDYARLRLQVWRDDGIAVYLNGAEVLRNNLPTGAIGHQTPALSEIAELTGPGEDPYARHYVEVTVPVHGLRPAANWIAAEVHPSSAADPDLRFDLALAAVLTTPETAQLVPVEAPGWEYRDSGDPGASWQTQTGWPTGTAPFGFPAAKTALASGASAAYFRRPLGASLAGFTHLRFLLLRDDGAAVYLAGTEIFRSNLPSAGTTPLQVLGATEQGRYVNQEIDLRQEKWKPLTQPSNPVLAASVHQHPAELSPAPSGAAAATRTPAALPLRLLVHVDSGGAARLLKEAYLVQKQDGSTVLAASHTAVPANYVAGRRVSAVGFDWQGATVDCGAGFGASGTVRCPEIALSQDHPTNPFVHRYHPDHDNWDAQYENPAEEAYEVRRKITLAFSGRHPPDPDQPERLPPPGWGYEGVGGTYTETLSGLHRDVITVQGWFELRRVSTIDHLEP